MKKDREMVFEYSKARYLNAKKRSNHRLLDRILETNGKKERKMKENDKSVRNRRYARKKRREPAVHPHPASHSNSAAIVTTIPSRSACRHRRSL